MSLGRRRPAPSSAVATSPRMNAQPVVVPLSDLALATHVAATFAASAKAKPHVAQLTLDLVPR